MEEIFIKSVNIAIEIGGTNCKVAIVNNDQDLNHIIANISSLITQEFKTTSEPEIFIHGICNWIIEENNIKSHLINKIGISMFGPLNLKTGEVLNTPKPGWKNFNVIESVCSNLKVDKSIILIETDVNCAAELEYKVGGHGVHSLAYITIGTGVGVGLIVVGNLIHGLQHPEGGHITVRRHDEDNFNGICSIHGDCLEGLVTNLAIKARKNLKSVEDCTSIEDNDSIWDILGYYIAQQCLSLLYIVSLEKIIIGGGIINRELLMDSIRKHFINLNNDYIDNLILKKDTIDKYIIRTGFKNNSGILSAFALIY